MCVQQQKVEPSKAFNRSTAQFTPLVLRNSGEYRYKQPSTKRQPAVKLRSRDGDEPARSPFARSPFELKLYSATSP